MLALLVYRADRGALWAALQSAELVRYGIASAVFVGVWLAFDAYILGWLFGRLGAAIPWHEMVRLRGATYLLLALSLHVANAAMIGLVQQRSGVSLARAAASMLVMYAGDLTALCGVSLLASLGVSSPLVSALRPVLAGLTLGLLGLFAVGLIMRRRLAGRPFFGVVADLGALDVAALIGLRAAFYGTFVAFAWVTLPALQIDLPLHEIAARMPVVMGIGALPITPAGLGTTQAAMLALFGELADPSHVLAYALLYGLTLVGLRIPIGAVLAPGMLGRSRAESRPKPRRETRGEATQ